MVENLNNFRNRLQWLRNLRIIATVSVIIIHITCRLLDGTIGTYSWWVGNFFDSSLRFAVPVFVMLSGALLLSKEYELGLFFKKKALRIFLPFLFWIFFYILFYLFREIHNTGSVSVYYVLNYIVSNLYTIPESAYHFWYIYMSIGLYLFVPIIGKWIRIATEKEIEYFLLVWVFVIILSETDFGPKLIGNLNLRIFSGYLGYLILGYYLSLKEIKWRKKTIQRFSFLFIVLGALFTILGTWLLSLSKGSYDARLHDYLSLNTVVLSTGFFLFVKTIELSYSNWLNTICDFVDKHSYGIYLVHVFVLECFVKFRVGLNFWSMSGKFVIFGVLITTVQCLGLSAVSIYMIDKLPFGKYISGVVHK
ncbi:MAG: acyltransferase family protein [Paludibacteraceae bacterium]